MYIYNMSDDESDIEMNSDYDDEDLLEPDYDDEDLLEPDYDDEAQEELSSHPQEDDPLEIDYTKFVELQKKQAITASPFLNFSPDGKKLVYGVDKTVRSLTDDSEQILRGHTGYVLLGAFSHKGDKIVSCSRDNTIKIWNAETGEVLKTLIVHGEYVSLVAFSLQGDKIVTSAGHTIKIWNLADGEVLTLEGHDYAVNTVAFSPGGDKIVSGSIDSTIKIWNVADGTLIRTLVGHEYDVDSVAFSSDGKRIVSGARDNNINIWNAETGVLENTLEGHESGSVYSVAFSPDGKRIVSGSDDGTIKIWIVANGVLENTLEGHDYDVTSVAFSPDGTNIISSSSSDKTMRIWGIPTQQQSHAPNTSIAVFEPFKNNPRIIENTFWFWATGQTQSIYDDSVLEYFNTHFEQDVQDTESINQYLSEKTRINTDAVRFSNYQYKIRNKPTYKRSEYTFKKDKNIFNQIINNAQIQKDICCTQMMIKWKDQPFLLDYGGPLREFYSLLGGRDIKPYVENNYFSSTKKDDLEIYKLIGQFIQKVCSYDNNDYSRGSHNNNDYHSIKLNIFPKFSIELHGIVWILLCYPFLNSHNYINFLLSKIYRLDMYEMLPFLLIDDATKLLVKLDTSIKTFKEVKEDDAFWELINVNKQDYITQKNYCDKMFQLMNKSLDDGLVAVSLTQKDKVVERELMIGGITVGKLADLTFNLVGGADPKPTVEEMEAKIKEMESKVEELQILLQKQKKQAMAVNMLNLELYQKQETNTVANLITLDELFENVLVHVRSDPRYNSLAQGFHKIPVDRNDKKLSYFPPGLEGLDPYDFMTYVVGEPDYDLEFVLTNHLKFSNWSPQDEIAIKEAIRNLERYADKDYEKIKDSVFPYIENKNGVAVYSPFPYESGMAFRKEFIEMFTGSQRFGYVTLNIENRTNLSRLGALTETHTCFNQLLIVKAKVIQLQMHWATVLMDALAQKDANIS